MPVPGAADISVSREPAATGAHEDVYVTIRDAQTLEHIAALDRPARILAAAKIGKTRLIDNMAVG